jgi:hypothetical protein
MKGLHMFDSGSFIELDDTQLNEELDNIGAGKKPVYKRPIRELLDAVGDKQGSIAVPWKELNPNAKTRATVLQGFKAALKNHPEGKRIKISANPEDAKVTLYVRKASN